MPKIDFFKKQKAKKTGNSGFEGKSINLASCKKGKKKKKSQWNWIFTRSMNVWIPMAHCPPDPRFWEKQLLKLVVSDSTRCGNKYDQCVCLDQCTM